MSVQKIVYCTAGEKATSGEEAAIAKLNALVGPHYEVSVVNGAKLVEADAKSADYVAGTLVAPYNSGHTSIDPDDLPDHPSLSANQVVLRDSDVLTLESSAGTVNVAITDNVATYTFVAP